MTKYKEEIHLLRAENKTYKQIAQELGIHRSTVHRALKPDSYELQKKKKRAYYQINYPRTRGRKVDCPTCSGKMNVGSKTCFNCYSSTIKKWDEVTVVAALKKYAAQHNCIPAAHKWQRFRNNPEIPSYTSIINVFGRWNNAIEAAGFESREPYKLKELS